VNRKEGEAAIGQLVIVNGHGDLWMDGELRPVIGPPHQQPPYPVSRFIRFAKSGLAVLLYEGVEYRVPLRNIERVGQPEPEGP